MSRVPKLVWRNSTKLLSWANLWMFSLILLVISIVFLVEKSVTSYVALIPFFIVETLGSECKKQFDLLTAEKKPEVKPEVKKVEPKVEEPKETVAPAPAPPIPLPVVPRENSSSNSLETEEPYFNSNGHVGVDGPFSFPPPSFSVPPPNTDFYGGWQQPFWNTSAPSWMTQPPPEASGVNSNQEEATPKEEEPVSLDLDTRIELLLKGKITAALNNPAFLQLQLDGSSHSGSSRSSSRAADHDGRNENCSSPPLSPPPSPFLSQEIYLDHHRAAHPEAQPG